MNQTRSQEIGASKRFNTLDKEYTALVFEACRLVDARDAGDTTAAAKLEAVRAKRDAVKVELRRRASFDRWEC